MKLKTYFDIYRLDEEYATGSRSKPILPDEAKDIIYTKCSDILNTYINSDCRIYRGAGGGINSFLYIEPSKFDRVSRNTTNYFTLIVDNSPRWKKYPKRSKSIVCSSSLKGSRQYGISYVVFPVNGTKIGVCRARDIWISFRKLKELHVDVSSFNDGIDEIFSAMNHIYGYSYSDDVSYKKLLSGFKSVDDHKDELISNISKGIYFFGDFFEVFKKMPKNVKFIDFIEDTLDPEDNGFEILTPSTYDIPPMRPQEVWLSGNSVLVSSDISENFIKELSMRN